MIEVTHLTQNYGPVVAVDDISFTILPGEIVGLLGPNGAGKTTTLKTMTCLLQPTLGTVKIGGVDVKDHSVAVRQKIGYLSESAPLYEEMNVTEYLRFAAEMHDVPKDQIDGKLARVARLCGLEHHLRHEMHTLSKGYHQRVGLAQSLIHDPEILILDEPTTGLDPNQRVEIRNLIKTIGHQKTVILSSHILSEVEATCDRVLIIHKGKIVASGTPQELKNAASTTTQLYLILEGKHDGDGLEQFLRSFPEIQTILQIQPDHQTTHVVLELKPINSAGLPNTSSPIWDFRKRFIHSLHAKGYEILEIYGKEQSLEDVFVQLTH